MGKTVGAFEARRQFGQILKDVFWHGESYVVEYHGEPVAAVVPLRVYEGWKQQREAFFDRLESLAARANLSPEEADQLAAEAVEWARQQTPDDQ